MGYIYCITNNVNGKQYIGQTKRNNITRLKEHFQIAENTRKNLHLYNAIRKYGRENFSITILKDGLVEDDLDKWEMYYIGLYDTFNNGYNNTVGGGGVRGYHHTDETKRKISDHNNPKAYTKERAEKISFANKGKKKSVEHRKKLSESAKQRVGIKNPFYGKHHSDKTKLVLHEANKLYMFKQYTIDKHELINIFQDIDDVCDYVLKQNLSKAKPQSIKYRIYATIEGRQKEAYGYSWVGEKCNDYPVRE